MSSTSSGESRAAPLASSWERKSRKLESSSCVPLAIIEILMAVQNNCTLCLACQQDRHPEPGLAHVFRPEKAVSIRRAAAAILCRRAECRAFYFGCSLGGGAFCCSYVTDLTSVNGYCCTLLVALSRASITRWNSSLSSSAVGYHGRFTGVSCGLVGCPVVLGSRTFFIHSVFQLAFARRGGDFDRYCLVAAVVA